MKEQFHVEKMIITKIKFKCWGFCIGFYRKTEGGGAHGLYHTQGLVPLVIKRYSLSMFTGVLIVSSHALFLMVNKFFVPDQAPFGNRVDRENHGSWNSTLGILTGNADLHSGQVRAYPSLKRLISHILGFISFTTELENEINNSRIINFS